MKFFSFLFSFLLFISDIYSQKLFTGNESAQSYKKVKIYLNNFSDVHALYKAGLEFDHPYYTKDNVIAHSAGAIIVFLLEKEQVKRETITVL